MITYNKKYLFDRTKSIDVAIQEKVRNAINCFVEEIQLENTNILSQKNKEKIMDIVVKYQNRIDEMFENGFSNIENCVNLKLKMKNINIKQTGNMNIDGEEIVSGILGKIIEQAIIELENEQIRDQQFLSQCMDRRIFIKKLFEKNLIGNKEIINIIEEKQYEEDKKQEEQNER